MGLRMKIQPLDALTLGTFPAQCFVATGLTSIPRWRAASEHLLPSHPVICPADCCESPAWWRAWRGTLPRGGLSWCLGTREASLRPRGGTTLASLLDSPWWGELTGPEAHTWRFSCCLGPSGTPTHPGLLFAQFFPYLLPLFPPLWC